MSFVYRTIPSLFLLFGLFVCKSCAALNQCGPMFLDAPRAKTAGCLCRNGITVTCITEFGGMEFSYDRRDVDSVSGGGNGACGSNSMGYFAHAAIPCALIQVSFVKCKLITYLLLLLFYSVRIRL